MSFCFLLVVPRACRVSFAFAGVKPKPRVKIEPEDFAEFPQTVPKGATVWACPDPGGTLSVHVEGYRTE